MTIWEVWSNHTHRRSPRLYTVSRVEEQGKAHWGCTCPDFEANGQWFPCKHILYVQYEV
ncbi:SWIM zinc finger family protein [Bellilinea sp.]|uniref:SWIM zinc finger family protein n=1 Tax=Bellilinea sp. TaxID=2838785 RepID=UPI002ADE16D9|nr:SWIM zinc finger family protein [Bellilinea sp.]